MSRDQPILVNARNRRPDAVPETTDSIRAPAAGRTFPTRIDMSLADRQRLQALLNQQLATAFDLYSQTKQAHWNVKGANFYQLHLLFDKLAGTVEGQVDVFAERVRALGAPALGTARMAAAASRLPEFPINLTTDMDFVRALAERYATYGAGLRSAIDEAAKLSDASTADVFTEASRAADLALYFLESHLQAGSARTAPT